MGKNLFFFPYFIQRDTDSVMIFFHPDIAESIRLGKEACAKYVNPEIPPPMKLLFENVKYPFCLLGKKKYISFEWEKSPQEYLGDKKYNEILKTKGSPEDETFILTQEGKIKWGPKFSAKGTVSKRRDACLYIKKLIMKIIDILTGKVKPPNGMSKIRHSVETAVKGVSDLMSGNVRYQDIIMSKSLQKPVLEYENELVQTTFRIIEEEKKKTKKNIAWEMKKIKNSDTTNRKNVIETFYRKFLLGKKKTKNLLRKYGHYWIVKAIEHIAVTNYELPKKKQSAPEHVVIALKKGKDNPGEEHTSGDRVFFVLVKKSFEHLKKGDKPKVGDMVEDPEYALVNRMELDYEEMAQRYVVKALCRLFGPIIGSHTFDHIDYDNLSQKEIKKKTEKVINKNREEVRKLLFSRQNIKPSFKVKQWGNIMKFVQPIPRCVGCGCRLKNNPKKLKRRKLTMDGCIIKLNHTNFLCKGEEEGCSSKIRRREILSAILKKRRKLTSEEYAVQVQCKLCQKNRYGFVKCANRDCQYFYLRREILTDIEDLDKKLYRTLCSIDAINTKGDKSTLFKNRKTDVNIIDKLKRVIIQEYSKK